MSEWRTVRLGDIGVFSKGLGVSKTELLSTGINAIRYGELYTQHSVKVDSITSFISAESAACSRPIEKGDLLLAGSGETIDEIGKSAVYLHNEPCCAGGDIIVFTPNHADPLYLAYYLNSPIARRELRRLGQGQSVVHIYSRDLQNLELKLPSLNEQKRITNLLELWNSYIKLLDRKIAAKKHIKKGLMQQLLTGKTRLPGFTDAWRSITLGEVGKVSMCKRVMKHQTSEVGDIPFYKIGTFGKYPDAYISRELFEEFRNKYSYPNKGDILLSASGTIGRRVVYNGAPAYFQDSNIIWIANDEKKVTNAFLYHAYENVTWHTAHGTIARLYNDNVRQITIEIPSIDEQNSIANVLDGAQQNIELLIKKRKEVFMQRKFLINNLVSGKIRVPESITAKEAAHA